MKSKLGRSGGARPTQSSLTPLTIPSSPAELLESLRPSLLESDNPSLPEKAVPASAFQPVMSAPLQPRLAGKPTSTVKGSRKGHLVAKVNHYFSGLGVAGIDVVDTIQMGDLVRFWGRTTDFAEALTSIQLNRKPVDRADGNCQVGMKVSRPVCVGDEVYKVSPREREQALGIHSEPNETAVGEVQHYYGLAGATVVAITKPLKVGDVIRFRGRTTDFTQTISSMELDRVSVPRSKGGSLVGLAVSQPVRVGDVVYRQSGKQVGGISKPNPGVRAPGRKRGSQKPPRPRMA